MSLSATSGWMTTIWRPVSQSVVKKAKLTTRKKRIGGL